MAIMIVTIPNLNMKDRDLGWKITNPWATWENHVSKSELTEAVVEQYRGSNTHETLGSVIVSEKEVCLKKVKWCVKIKS